MGKKYYEKNKDYFKIWYKKLVETPIGRSKRLNASYNQQDRKQGRPKGDLTAEWTAEQIQKGCSHCDEKDWRKIGLNRKDNSLSHTKTNCEPCCKKCNDELAKIERQKKVDQIDIVTCKVVATYQSVKDAAEILGFNKSSISRCCNGGYFDHRKNKWINSLKYKGYLWRYNDEW